MMVSPLCVANFFLFPLVFLFQLWFNQKVIRRHDDPLEKFPNHFGKSRTFLFAYKHITFPSSSLSPSSHPLSFPPHISIYPLLVFLQRFPIPLYSLGNHPFPLPFLPWFFLSCSVSPSPSCMSRRSEKEGKCLNFPQPSSFQRPPVVCALHIRAYTYSSFFSRPHSGQ